MIGYHLLITSKFPLAVPLEWSVLFMYITAFLFLGYPASGRVRPQAMDPASPAGPDSPAHEPPKQASRGRISPRAAPAPSMSAAA
jgi:Transmembrane protein of unknown function (DUF3556)